MSRAALGPLSLLLAYGVAFGWAALGRGLVVFDDHPGQLYRLWHAVTLGPAPWRWNPGWWAGYAELQFYPPGLSYAGALLHGVTLGALHPEGAYRALVWVALLLPAASTYWLLARALGSGWLALPGGFLALVISAETRSGLEEGVRWGLLAARLGWGLLPALGAALLGWLEPAPRPRATVALLLAAVVLVHPAHAPLAFAMVVLAAALAPGAWRDRARAAAAALALGLGLTAFWLVPLLAHLPLALPLTWGDASLLRLARRFADYPVLALLLGAALVGGIWCVRRAAAERPLVWLLSLGPAAIAIVLADALLAAVGVHWLPVDRVADGLVLALILGASVALLATVRSAPRLPASALAAVAMAAAVSLSSGRHEPGLSLWPAAREWPTDVEVTRGTRLDDLWRALRSAPAGRILFVRSSVPLQYGPEWWRPHSHVTALAPMRAGREIVGGTFTHPSPVAGFVYSGSAVAPIALLAEQRDGLALFGTPLAELAPTRLEGIVEALRVSAVVALDEDAPRLAVIGTATGFGEPRRIGPFLLYVARVARPLPEVVADGHLRLPARDGAPWRDAGIAFSPLWSALGPDGRALGTRRGVTGLLEIDASAAGGGAIDLIYRPGPAEWVGLAISAVAASAWTVSAARRRLARSSA